MSNTISINYAETRKFYDGIDCVSGYRKLITRIEGDILKLLFRNQLNKKGNQFENQFKEICNKKIAYNKKIRCCIKTVSSAIHRFKKLNLIETTMDKSRGNLRHLKVNITTLKASLPTFEETEQKIEKELKEATELTPIQKKFKKAKEGIYQGEILNYISKKEIDFPKGLLKRFNMKEGIKYAYNTNLLKIYYSVNITNYCTSAIDYSDLKVSSDEIKKEKLDTFIQNTWTRALVRIYDLWNKEIENYPKIPKEELLHEILRRAIETGKRVEGLPTKVKI